MENVGKYLVEKLFLGTADTTGLTCEVPFTGATPAAVAAAAGMQKLDLQTSLVQIFTDAPHPEAGNGALLLMRLPVAADPEQVALQANELNRTEAQGDALAMLLGAWCPDPSSDTTLAFCSFVPNTLSR
jgi:hypothetical protein